LTFSPLRLFRFWSRERAAIAAINTVTIEDAVVCHTLPTTFFPLRVGFIEYNGELKINASLLSVVLHE
jgi:hypothetical protein